MQWAIDHGATVINLSLGTDQSSRFLKQAIDAARNRGVIVVAAAGNDGSNRVDFPARESSVVCTTAINADNTRASFANYGSPVDLVAPGTGIRSTFGAKGYASWSGTSFAVPFVAGAAALVRAANPGLRLDKVIDQLENGALGESAKPNPIWAVR
ncbi:MAG: S8 family serine peptidase [Armatimonas sp.]